MSLASNYLKLQVWAILFLVVLVVSFNYVIDPYDIYGKREIEGINAIAPERETRLRMHKAAAVEAIQPAGLILGSSRANRALDPTHPSWRAKVVYNLAFPGGNIFETRRFLEHAHSVRPLEQVVFAADFFMFNAMRTASSDFNNVRLRSVPYLEYIQARMREAVSTLLSFDALSDSVGTFLRQRDPCGPDVVWLYVTRADGFRGVRTCAPYDPHRVFTHIIPALLRPEKTLDGRSVFYRPYSFEHPVNHVNSFGEYEKIIQLAYSGGIDLRIVILPVHAWQLEVIWAEGLWPSYERWKRELLAVSSRNAEGRPLFPVWDFTAYNPLTTEEVPLPGRSVTPMNWFVDPSHPTKEFGDRVLDIVLADNGTEKSNPRPRLGVLLAAETIDNHLAAIRQDRDAYARRNEARLEEVYRWVR